MSIQATRTADNRIHVTSPYWQIGIDLSQGGALNQIRFPHGSGQNVLLSPLCTSVDDARDTAGPAQSVTIDKTERGVRIICIGELKRSDGSGSGIGYQHIYEIDEDVFLIRTTLHISTEMLVSTVGIGETEVSGTLDEFGYRSHPWDDPDRETRSRARWAPVPFSGWPMVEMDHIPFHYMLFDRYVEGFDWTPTSDFGRWETQLTQQLNRGYFALAGQRDASGIDVQCKVLRQDNPVPVGPGSYEYSYYLGLPKIMERTPRKWYHLAFNNHPWPTDGKIATWAKAGVNVVRLHNDYSADGNFWHDGSWPPYGDEDMQELRRIIATCHTHNIKVIPYFSIHELHPRSPGYEHVDEWCRTMAPDQTPYHNLVRNGEYGVQMCPHSGWIEQLKQNVEKAYRELGFDGIYYDWFRHLPCMNEAHSDGLHSSIDEVIEMGRWTRQLIGRDGVLILHIYGDYASIPLGNMSDLLVCMEELSNQETLYYHWENLPLASVLGETVQRCPCRPYRPDHAELRLKNLIAQLCVMGMFPCDSTDETLRYFAAFSRYPLEEYTYKGPWTGVVDTSDKSVAGALYAKNGHAVLVLSNTGIFPVSDARWRVDLGYIGWDVSDTYRLTLPERPEVSQQVDGKQLVGDGLGVSLQPMEYLVMEIEPVAG